MKDNHISPIEAVESISRISDEPPSGENISFDTATTPFSVDSFVLKLFNLHDDQAESTYTAARTVSTSTSG